MQQSMTKPKTGRVIEAVRSAGDGSELAVDALGPPVVEAGCHNGTDGLVVLADDPRRQPGRLQAVREDPI